MKTIKCKENFKSFYEAKIKPGVIAVTTMGAMLINMSYVSASGAEDLASWALRIIAGLLMVPAVFVLVEGVVAWVNSLQDGGDGPSRNKAINKTAGGVMLAILCITIMAKASDLVSYMMSELSN